VWRPVGSVANDAVAYLCGHLCLLQVCLPLLLLLLLPVLWYPAGMRHASSGS
jgi:hypothetical protein